MYKIACIHDLAPAAIMQSLNIKVFCRIAKAFSVEVVKLSWHGFTSIHVERKIVTRLLNNETEATATELSAIDHVIPE